MANLPVELGVLIHAGLDLSQELHDFGSTLGSAGEQLKWLATDITLFSSVLRHFKDTLEGTKSVRASTSAIQTAHEVVQRCEAIFSEMKAAIRHIRSTDTQVYIIRRIQWWFKKSKVALIREQLSTCSATLHLMLVTFQFADRLANNSEPLSESERQDERDRMLTYSLFRAQQTSNERLTELERQFLREERDAGGLQYPGLEIDEPLPPYSPPQEDAVGTVDLQRQEHPLASNTQSVSRIAHTHTLRSHVDRLSVFSLGGSYDFSKMNERQIKILQTNHLLREWFQIPDPLASTIPATVGGYADLEKLPTVDLGSSPTTAREAAVSPEAPHSPADPAVQIFKSFRVSMEDPCWKVLPAALRKYNIMADWRQYQLYVVYGDLERKIGLEEMPLAIFKELDRSGKKPMFMLRRIRSLEAEGEGGNDMPTSSPSK